MSQKTMFAIALLGFVALVAAGCSSNGGGAKAGAATGDLNQLSAGEQPVLGQGVVQFQQQAGQSLEAWEVVTEGNQTYLNYSRFSFGDQAYNGQPTYLCTAMDAGKKYVGLSENADRVRKAMLVVSMQENGGQKPATIDCVAYADALTVHPEFTMLSKVFDSIH